MTHPIEMNRLSQYFSIARVESFPIIVAKQNNLGAMLNFFRLELSPQHWRNSECGEEVGCASRNGQIFWRLVTRPGCRVGYVARQRRKRSCRFLPILQVRPGGILPD